MSKEYGKLTAEQFQTLIGKLPELQEGREEMGGLLARLTKSDSDSLMVRDFNWGALYELSYAQHVALAMYAFGLLPWFGEIASSEDPQQAMLDAWLTEIQDEQITPGFEPQDLLALAYSLQRTVLSVMLFQRSLSGLVQEVRESDSMEALFNAARCPVSRTQTRPEKFFGRAAHLPPT
jgi:hypothetical protein